MNNCREESQDNWYAEILEFISELEIGKLFHQIEKNSNQLRKKKIWLAKCLSE